MFKSRMKKLLLASVVIISTSTATTAADLAAPAPEVYDWTGGYIGLNAGAAWNNSELDISELVLGLSLDGDDTVFTGGVEAGYNWQMDNVVIGVEADFNYLGFDEEREVDGQQLDFSLKMKANWFGTLRGRVGFAADNMLFYGTGGLAYGHAEVEGCVDGVTLECDSEDKVNWGWTAGGGIQFAFDESWILGAEYLYVDFGSTDLEPSCACDGGADVRFSVARVKLDFKFN